jgi:nitroimidazol reductase NimA-like FMN-containing flavoprotein (pyridoxamine 5'-phosphate oxidase superfamily)
VKVHTGALQRHDDGAPRSSRTTVRRRAGRGRYDRATIDAILDKGLVGHVAFTSGGHPYAIPMLYARGSDGVYLHGSPLSRVVGSIADGIELCLTVTLIDGLVLARSAFHHSVNYKSVVALGTGRAVRDREEKRAALRTIVERIVPGRSDDVRGPSEAELRATEVVTMEIAEASGKVRTGPPVDAAEDYALPVWAGELPLRLAADRPKPDARCTVPIPTYVEEYGRALR